MDNTPAPHRDAPSPYPGALYSLAEIRTIESAALAVALPAALMQRAGRAAAAAAVRIAPAGPVLVLAGPGNNGGDALEAAAALAHAGLQVSILLFADPAQQPPDASQALARARASAARFEGGDPMTTLAAAPWSLVLDGLYGIGLARPIAGIAHSLIEALNTLDCPVLALDVPSGLDADTGAIVGPGGVAVRATHTITFIGDKPGLHTGLGRDYAGLVEVARLDIAQRFYMPPRAWLNKPGLFASNLRRRPHASHKGSFGDVMVLGGAAGMAGAPILAARAALHCGAGRVFAGFLDQAPAYDPGQPELMCRHAADLTLDGAALVVGPGLGMGAAAGDLLRAVLAAAAPLVLDADGLNLVAREPGLQNGLQAALSARTSPALLTPHPLEAARLLACKVEDVQRDRPAAARELARRFHAVVVLKGSGSAIARPDGELAVNATGNPALATAGSGDVLSGICGALLAQGWPAWEAALGAVWIHGRAADALVERGTGPVGLTAGELVPAARGIFNRLVADFGS